MPTLSESDINGRLLVLLGQQQQIPLGSANAGQSRVLFITNNNQWPSGGARIVLAFCIITASGTPFDANTIIQIGSSGSNDWLTGAAMNIGGLASPLTLWAAQNTSGPGSVYPVYGDQVPITILNQSSGASSKTATVACYGWAQ